MKKIVVILGVAMIAGIGSADSIRYRQSGNWSAVSDGANNTGSAGWYNDTTDLLVDNRLPGTGDLAIINYGGNTVTLTTTATAGQVRVGQDGAGNFVIASGGTLTTGGGLNGDVTTGQGNGIAGTGLLTVNDGGTLNVGGILYTGNKANGTVNISGEVNVTSHLWTGWGVNADTTPSTGTINIYDGGVLSVAGQLGLNWNNNGAVGIININDGGTLDLAQIHATGNSIQGTSVITIDGSGVLTKSGNFVNTIQTQYIDTGKIVGAGGAALTLTYDGTDTFVTVPEPTTIGLLGLGGIATVLARRFKNRC